MNKEIKGDRRERKKAATRQLIMNVAMELFNKEGMEATTMEQIAENADIAKGTLYNYFPEKEAIIAANTEEVIADFTQGLQNIHPEKNSRDCILSIFKRFVKHGLKHKAHFKTYIAYRMSSMVNQNQTKEFSSSLEEALCKIIETAQSQGEIRQELPAKGLAHNLEISLLMHCLQLIQNEKLDFDSVAAVDLFFAGAGRAFRSADN